MKNLNHMLAVVFLVVGLGCAVVSAAGRVGITSAGGASSVSGNFNSKLSGLLLGGAFPAGETAAMEGSGFALRKDIAAFEKGKWHKKWDEKDVFRVELSPLHKTSRYTLRIGKGGHVYSIVTPVGEIMPPQNKEHAWVDDTLLLTAHQYDLKPQKGSPGQFTAFIHQAGMYPHQDSKAMGGKAFYAPLVAERYDLSSGQYSTLTLGMISCGPSYNRSDLLMYSKIREMGDGVFEVTYMLYNYNTSYTNAQENYTTDFSPWGGVRTSVLPNHVLSNTDGSYRLANVNFGATGSMVDASKTGGWAAAVQDAGKPEAQAFAWIFGTKRYGRITKFSYGDARRDDFNVQALLIRDKLPPGTLVWLRMYFAAGKLGTVAANGKKYQGKVAYGIWSIGQAESKTIPLYLRREGGQTVLQAGDAGRPAMYVYAQPVKDSKPLYLIKNLKTGKYHATCDPYMLMKRVPIPRDRKGRTGIRPYDGSTKIVKIFGYVMPKSKINSKLTYKPLADILTDRSYFPGTGIYDPGIMVRTTQN
jgi:hypothetical protein